MSFQENFAVGLGLSMPDFLRACVRPVFKDILDSNFFAILINCIRMYKGKYQSVSCPTKTKAALLNQSMERRKFWCLSSRQSYPRAQTRKMPYNL